MTIQPMEFLFNGTFLLVLFVCVILLLKIKVHLFHYVIITLLGIIPTINSNNYIDYLLMSFIILIYLITFNKGNYLSIIMPFIISFTTLQLYNMIILLLLGLFNISKHFSIPIFCVLIFIPILSLKQLNKIINIEYNACKIQKIVLLISIVSLIPIHVQYFHINIISLISMLCIYFLIIILLYIRTKFDEIFFEREGILNEIACVNDFNLKIRSQKHDFNNHLQVVSGLIQTKKYEQCTDYILNINRHGFSKDNINTGILAINALLDCKQRDAQKDNINFSINIIDQIPCSFNMQSWEIINILGNLIDNAIHEEQKSKEANKLIQVTLKNKDTCYQFIINNIGSYIDSETLSKIFRPGFTTKSCKNSGMGLHILRDIVERHGGSVTVESSIEFGTTFCLNLPKDIPQSYSEDVVDTIK